MRGAYRRCILFIGFTLLLGLGATAAKAAPFTVQDLGISRGAVVKVSLPGFYKGKVWAGVNQLVVNGVAMDGFCIDPFHPSVPSSPGYVFLDLQNAPKAPGTMDAVSAGKISDLWALFYSPTISNKQAAGLQIAIWEIVGGSRFSVRGNDYGASSFLQQLQSYTGPRANLIALSGPGQDYAVLAPAGLQGSAPNGPAESVPDSGSTIFLFALVILLLPAASTQVLVKNKARR